MDGQGFLSGPPQLRGFPGMRLRGQRPPLLQNPPGRQWDEYDTPAPRDRDRLPGPRPLMEIGREVSTKENSADASRWCRGTI